ncbi:unnamed protein product [Caenorhabditis auriculariae]|uniref:Uncharacterized protein n=1 Tax=Caenorhabditis auriculariae TaxID=2777116 RepID=A0A8S1H9G5_9PELO|nr:unnamed protein product [Caenorhabditis auriculariae]
MSFAQSQLAEAQLLAQAVQPIFPESSFTNTVGVLVIIFFLLGVIVGVVAVWPKRPNSFEVQTMKLLRYSPPPYTV